MAPMIPSYDDLSDTRLEEVLRERAFAEGADLWIGRTEGAEWRAAYRHYGPAVGRGEEFTEGQAAAGPTKRAALIALAQVDDIGTIT
ncbi:MAG TPA: hypothetical protein VHZ54_06935 [Solirubrobacterales bacterium]|jgi:hypothetical protein|nr:hypothetical protein [Solirubrobacterales bacterium]